MNKDPDIITLFELYVSVTPKGFKGRISKYRVKKTPNNYVSAGNAVDSYKDGFDGILYQRIRLDTILIVRSGFDGDRANRIVRAVYFLEGQEEMAKLQVRENITKTLTEMQEQLNATRDAWDKRNSSVDR